MPGNGGQGKDIGISGEWILDRTEGMEDMLKNGLEMGYISRKMAAAADSWKSKGTAYNVEQNGNQFTIESGTGGKTRSNTFIADGKPFHYEVGGDDEDLGDDNAEAFIDGDMLVVVMQGKMGGKTGEMTIKRFIQDGELYQEIEFNRGKMTRIYVLANDGSEGKHGGK